jgi:hypothetical protein
MENFTFLMGKFGKSTINVPFSIAFCMFTRDPEGSLAVVFVSSRSKTSHLLGRFLAGHCSLL